MAKKKKLIFAVFGLLLTLVLFWAVKPFAIAPINNVNITVITGAGGMPGPGFDGGEGEILKGEDLTAVFTQPFLNLENWEQASEVKRIDIVDGKASINLKPGRYGLYYVYNGQKVLYGDLQLANPRNDVIRDKQGPWFVNINEIGITNINFSINPQRS